MSITIPASEVMLMRFLPIRVNSLLRSSLKLLRDSTIRSLLQTMRITALLRKEKLLTSIMNIVATVCHISMYPRILSSQICQLETTSMMRKSLRLTKSWESQLLRKIMRLTTTGLKIQIVNRLCIVEVLTTLWYLGSQSPLYVQMPERSKGTVCKTVFRGFESHSRFYTNLMDREENFLKESGFRELKRFTTLAANFTYLLPGLKPM